MTTQTQHTQSSFNKAMLPNGLRIVTSEMSHTRSVSISIFIGVGSRYEDEQKAGISHFIEHMVFKGTERRPNPKDISGTIENTGGILKARSMARIGKSMSGNSRRWPNESHEWFFETRRWALSRLGETSRFSGLMSDRTRR